jgi:hypothetical protein
MQGRNIVCYVVPNSAKKEMGFIAHASSNLTMPDKEAGSFKAARAFRISRSTLDRYIKNLDKLPST